MSRHDKPNRFADKPEFKAVPPAPPKSEPVIYDPDEDENAPYFNFGQIGAFFIGFWGKIVSFSKSAASKTWGGCQSSVQWIWSGLRKVPSYCVIRWDSGDKAEVPDTPSKPELVHTNVKPDAKAKVSSAKMDYDEDELTPSRWWSLGIKTAAVAAALLILTGGYFGVKTLLQKTPVEVADLENAEPSETTVSDTSQETVPFVADPVTPKTLEPTQVLEPPTQGPLLANDPFSAPPAAPAVAAGHFGTASVPPESPMPITESAPLKNTAESTLPSASTALQPLAPLEAAPTVPQLQPLAALDSVMPPPSTFAAAPVASVASAGAPVASNYKPRQTSRNKNNPTFSDAPTPPVVNTLPQTSIPQTIAMTEPVKEIVPLIPLSGTIQNVPPPVTDKTATIPNTPGISVAEVPSVTPNMYSNESAPIIPKDAPVAATSVPVVAVSAAPIASVQTMESASQILPADSQPMDWQLWEQYRKLRDGTEAEPSNLRLDRSAAAAEPALRFTPRQFAPAANGENNPMSESVDSLRGLLPMASAANPDVLQPAPAKMESALADQENAPKPAYAEAMPAYRENQADGERGMTFQSRIDSEIRRSPSAMETYIVQQGDTYMTISDKFYGTSLLYTALARHNQQQGVGWRPAEGVVIEVPTAEYLRMKYGETANRRLDSQNSTVRYIVQEGDTIFRLATDKLQDSTRWREIYAINADRLQDVRDLRPGMEILLPVVTARLNRQQAY